MLVMLRKLVLSSLLLLSACGEAPGEPGNNSTDGGEVDTGGIGQKSDALVVEPLDMRPGEETGSAEVNTPPPGPDGGGAGQAEVAVSVDTAPPADARPAGDTAPVMPAYPQCAAGALEVVYCGGAINERHERVYQLKEGWRCALCRSPQADASGRKPIIRTACSVPGYDPGDPRMLCVASCSECR